MRRAGGSLRWQWVPFSRTTLVISRGLAPQLAVNAMAHSQCAHRDLRHEVALTRFPPPVRAVPFDEGVMVSALYDPEEFATLYHADKDRACAACGHDRTAARAPSAALRRLARPPW